MPRPLNIPQRQLAASLRRMRESASLTQEEAAQHLGWSDSKVSKIEQASVRVTNEDLRRMLDLYEVAGDQRMEIEARNRPRQKGWYDGYREYLPSDYVDYIEVEAQLADLWSYNASIVHGLMQTKAYARTLITNGAMGLLSPGEIDRRVEVRMKRQELLVRSPTPLALWIVVAEPALSWQIGGHEVMGEQIERLLEIADLPNVTLQVLPASKGEHPAVATGSFDILKFPSPHEPNVVYTESLTANRYVDEDAEVHRYTLAFDHIRATALGAAESRSYLDRVATEFRSEKETHSG